MYDVQYGHLPLLIRGIAKDSEENEEIALTYWFHVCTPGPTLTC